MGSHRTWLRIFLGDVLRLPLRSIRKILLGSFVNVNSKADVVNGSCQMVNLMEVWNGDSDRRTKTHPSQTTI